MTTPQRADDAARAIEAIDDAYAKAMGSESLLDAMHAGEVLCYQTRENWPAARAHIRTLEEQVARLSQEGERLRGLLREWKAVAEVDSALSTASLYYLTIVALASQDAQPAHEQ